jgi:hypothetical protein
MYVSAHAFVSVSVFLEERARQTCTNTSLMMKTMRSKAST